MSIKDKFGAGKKRGAYTMAGVAAAGLIGAAVIVNSNRLGVTFDPDKYTNSSVADSRIAFDSVVYSNGSDMSEMDSVSREDPESEQREEEALKENDDRENSIKDENGDELPSDGVITVGRVTDNGVDAPAVDAVYGVGTGEGRTPVIKDGGTGTSVSGVDGGAGTAAAVSTAALSGGVPQNNHNSTAADNDTNNNTNNNPPLDGDRRPATPQPTQTPVPSQSTAAPTSEPTAAPTRRPSGGSGGSKQPQKTDTSNPSNSTDVAPVQKPNINNGGGNGGGHGDYGGESVSMYYTGSFKNLCVGQSMTSVFSPYFERAVYLKFEKGAMVLKDSDTTANGFSLSGLDTKNALPSATAVASFTYNTKKYSINIDYSVSQWSLGLHLFDGSSVVDAMTPDENLRIDLSRYYAAFKRMNPNFCGWRDKDGDEIYTTECIMTKPDMQLYPCLSMSVPDKNDVGEEYEIKDVTDADVSGWDVYENCRVLTISGDVKNINIAGIAKKFPNLEEIRVDEENTAYTSVDGVLYKGDELLFVPPAKKSISEYKDGVASVSENAFEGVKAEKITLPETVTEISNGAFRNAAIDTLEITAEKYHISDKAFYSDTAVPSVKRIVSQTLYVPDFDSEAFEFGEAAPVIVVPDSMYDRAYQYYMSTWGIEIDKLRGGGAASKILQTQSGAQTRNSLINGAVYSFFGSPKELTLASVCADTDGSFVCDERTVTIAADAFVGCDKITELVIPAGTVSLESGCFNGLTGLSSITFKGAPPKVDDAFFEVFASDITAGELKIYTPAQNYGDYTDEWGSRIDSVCGEGTADRVIDMDNDSFETIDGARYLRDENGLVLIRVTPSADKDFIPAEGTYKIMAGAFETSLDSVIIPDTVTEIGEGDMNGRIGRLFINSASVLDVSGIKSGMIFVPESAEEEYLSKYPDIRSAAESYSADKDGIVRTDNALLYVPDTYKGELNIADDIELIYEGAAENCADISKIIIGSGVKTIEENAFYNCRSLSELDMTKAESLSAIGGGAFYTCVSLGELAMPASLDDIGDSAFYGCDNLTTVMFDDPERLKAIGDRAFYGCNSLTGFNGSDGVSLENLDSLEKLGTEAFAASPLIKSVSLPPMIEEIPEGLFRGCVNLGDIQDWGGTLIISENAFSNTALNNVRLNESSVEEIRAGAFADCGRLDTILAGDTLKIISSDFAEDGARILLALCASSPDLEGTDCAALIENGKIYKTVYALGDNAERAKELFGEDAVDARGIGVYRSDKENGDLYIYENNQFKLVKAGTKTVDFDMSDDAVVKEILPGAFDDCDSIVTATIDCSVSEIPAYAFDGCTSLESVSFRNDKKYDNEVAVGEYAFRGCTSLKNIEFNLKMGTIGKGVFENCSALKDFYWGAVSEVIPEDAFSGCTSLEKIRLSIVSANTVAEIGDRCFKDCTSLTDVMGFNNVLFSSLKNIGDSAFENCASLEKLELPDSVSSVGNEAFAGCEKLEPVTVNSEPFDIGNFVFGFTPGESYFFLGETDEETYNKYLEFWRMILDADYGEGAAEKLVRATIIPSASPAPSDEPTPSEEPLPSDSPVPTKEPEPSEEPHPSDSPMPTIEPEPSEEPHPSDFPEPTKEPEPTEEPIPLDSPEPAQEPTQEPEPTEEPAADVQEKKEESTAEHDNAVVTEGDKASE